MYMMIRNWNFGIGMHCDDAAVHWKYPQEDLGPMYRILPSNLVEGLN